MACVFPRSNIIMRCTVKNTQKYDFIKSFWNRMYLPSSLSFSLYTSRYPHSNFFVQLPFVLLKKTIQVHSLPLSLNHWKCKKVRCGMSLTRLIYCFMFCCFFIIIPTPLLPLLTSFRTFDFPVPLKSQCPVTVTTFLCFKGFTDSQQKQPDGNPSPPFCSYPSPCLFNCSLSSSCSLICSYLTPIAGGYGAGMKVASARFDLIDFLCPVLYGDPTSTSSFLSLSACRTVEIINSLLKDSNRKSVCNFCLLSLLLFIIFSICISYFNFI